MIICEINYQIKQRRRAQMGYKTVFKRQELKFIISESQKRTIAEAMGEYMEPDSYGVTTIRNLYFDTPDYRLIRRSIEKPAYKEKLRIRCYKRVGAEDTVFVELKKKYNGIVYKRRLPLREREAMLWTSFGTQPSVDTQIQREIDCFLKQHAPLAPACFISYDREAYFERGGGELRITFDSNMLFREEALTLASEPYGTRITDGGVIVMEVKSTGGLPLWLTGLLSGERIYKTSFSKYGTAYRDIIFARENKLNKYGQKEIHINA